MENTKTYESLLNLSLLMVTKVEIKDQNIQIYCESKLTSAYCPCCLKPCSCVNQSRERIVQDLSISGRRVFLHLTSRQFICQDCNRFFHEKFSFVSSYEQMTIRYENFIYHRCIGADLTYVSVQEDLCWYRVDRIFNKWSAKKIKEAKLFEGVRAIGIDEFALKKGHKDFVCVIVNLETGVVIDLLEDRSKANVMNYFNNLGSTFCNQIEVFSSDMWEGYINAAKALFPNAYIVVDRFHFFAHLKKALDNSRKALRKKFPQEEDLKNVKWLFLKNKENLTENQKEQIDSLLINPLYVNLKQAYEAKESFRAIMEEDICAKQADEKLTHWVIEVLLLNNKYLNKFVKTFTNWYEYILNYFKDRWSNGSVEGINNRIKMIKRRAFGYDDFDRFRRRILVEFMRFH